MRKNEKEFLDLVEYELKSLDSIQIKLGWEYDQAVKFAEYLEKEGLVRTTKMRSNFSPSGYIYAICKPIDKRKWKEKYWWLISIFSYVVGIATTLLMQSIK